MAQQDELGDRANDVRKSDIWQVSFRIKEAIHWQLQSFRQVDQSSSVDIVEVGPGGFREI